MSYKNLAYFMTSGVNVKFLRNARSANRSYFPSCELTSLIDI